MMQRIIFILLLFFPLCILSQRDSTSACNICKNATEASYKIIAYNQKIENEFSKKASRIHSKILRIQSHISAALSTLEKKGIQAPVDIRELDYSINRNLRTYIPLEDSLRTYFKFCAQTNEGPHQFDSSFGQLKNTVREVADINNRLEQQMNVLQKELTRLGLQSPKILNQLSKYSLLIDEANSLYNSYEDAFSNGSAIESAVLELFRKSPVFGDFFSKNSTLAGMFGTGSLINIPATNFQSRYEMAELLKDKFGSSSTAVQLMKDGLGTALSETNKCKDSTENVEVNKVNQRVQKIKIKPLFSFQAINGEANTVFSVPKVFDAGAGFMCEINERLISGASISYKLGIGERIDKIKLTHEGFGGRCFFDWRINQQSNKPKLFDKIFITGMYELNYWRRFQSIYNIDKRLLDKSLYAGLTRWIHYKGRNTAIRILYKMVGNVNTTQSLTCRFDFSL